MKTQKKYVIYDVSEVLASGADVEYLGTKYKGWLTYNYNDDNKPQETRVLFKEGRPGTGENWAEKIASELAELLGLPHAHYDLAYLDTNRPCVISPNFLNASEELRLGNQLIEGFTEGRKFKNTGHTLEAILNALQQNNVSLPRQTPESILQKSSDLLIGYLCFDTWIANSDRHAENWGIITKTGGRNVLAPTFDHASSLGRNETDKKRSERLQTKDKGYNVSAYVQKAETPIYNGMGYALNTMLLMKECKQFAPKATTYWIDKIANIIDEGIKVKTIFELMPDEFMSLPAKEFAKAILHENAKRLRDLL